MYIVDMDMCGKNILQETFETVRLITKQYKGQKWKQN